MFTAIGSDDPPSLRRRASDAASPVSAASILVVDDERLVRWSLRQRLEFDGYSVSEADSALAARRLLPSGFDAVLLDYRLPDVEGLELLREIRSAHPETPVIMLTGHSTVERAVDAMSEGAFYFVSKPFDVDQVSILLQRALDTNRLRRELRALLARNGHGASLSLVGEAPRMHEVRRLIEKIARSPTSTVLLTGESGVGKDVAARMLHALSDRASGPFMNITCSALPEALLESELFGHERGSFTDAKQRKQGLLEQADGGSVFLDEIGEMAPALQAKLLRFLEDKVFRRVGGTDEFRPDVRIIAATNRDLRAEARRGAFREDLYYRLAVLHVAIPPLRDREGDVELLAKYFVEHFKRAFNKPIREISVDALSLLASYGWPGNVRELKNVIERAVLLSEKDVLGVDDFPLLQPASGGSVKQLFELPPEGVNIEALEQALVLQALRRTRGNKTRAARLLGMTRDQIRHRVEKYAPDNPELAEFLKSP